MDQKLKHVTKGIVEMPFKHWQDWDINHIFRKSVPVFDHPLGREMLPHIQSKAPQHSFEPFPYVLSLDPRKKGSAPPSPHSPLRKL